MSSTAKELNAAFSKRVQRVVQAALANELELCRAAGDERGARQMAAAKHGMLWWAEEWAQSKKRVDEPEPTE